MKETACRFGATQSLIGVMTQPQAAVEVRAHPAVILLNAGIIHRVGPHRLYVRIARQLATAGFVVLRFDLSGIGDSTVRHDHPPYEASAIRETQEAMNFVNATTGVQRFILMGICGGADNAMRVIQHDRRIVAAVLMDGYAFPTLRYFLHSYSTRLFNLRSWWNVVTGASAVWGKLQHLLLSRVIKHTRPRSHAWDTPSPEKIIATVRTCIDRGVHLCFIYSGGSPAYYNYRRHLQKAFQPLTASGKLRLEFFSQSNHTYTLLCHQELLLHTLLDWAQSLVPSRSNLYKE